MVDPAMLDAAMDTPGTSIDKRTLFARRHASMATPLSLVYTLNEGSFRACDDGRRRISDDAEIGEMFTQFAREIYQDLKSGDE